MTTTILFADNHNAIRQYCRVELERYGYRVVLADDGEDVLGMLDEMEVDLVILDQHMPLVSGQETMRCIKRWYPHLPVILFTSDEDFAQCAGQLFDAAVVKSGDLTDLRQAIADSLVRTRSSSPTTRS